MFRRTKFHLRRLARRALNDLAKTGHPVPELADLAEALAALVWDDYSELVYVREPGGEPLGRMGPRWLDGDDAVRRVAASAARYALSNWTPDYIEERQRRGAKGGRNSRRGPSKATQANLARLIELGDLTVAQQVAETGLTESTVKRLRKKKAELDRLVQRS